MAKKGNEMVKRDSEEMAETGFFSGVLSAEDAARAGAAVRKFVSMSGDDGPRAIRGIYLGEGAPVDFTDESTGETRSVRTVEIASPSSPNVRAVILAPANLWTQLARVAVGSDVQIVRESGLQRTRRGHYASQWTVFDFGAGKGQQLPLVK